MMLFVIAVLLFLILYVLAPDFVSEAFALLFKLALWLGMAGIVVALVAAVGVSGFEVVTGAHELNTPAPHQPAWDTEDLRALGWLFGFYVVASAAQGLWKLAGDAYLNLKVNLKGGTKQ